MDTERTVRFVSVLAEAAGQRLDEDSFGGDQACRQRTIDELESLGFVEARDGDPSRGEDPSHIYLTGITSLGLRKLDELRQDLSTGNAQTQRRRLRRFLAMILGSFGA